MPVAMFKRGVKKCWLEFRGLPSMKGATDLFVFRSRGHLLCPLLGLTTDKRQF